MKKLFTRHYRKVVISSILLFCFSLTLYLVFYNLGKAPLENWDEAWYAEVTKQMLRTKEFIVLSWNHAMWLEKPPLYMWLSALTASVVGLSELSARLPSAISGACSIILVLVYAYRSFGIIPALLAFVSLALNNIFIYRVRSGNIDSFVTLLILLTYFVLVSKHKYKYPLLGVLFAGIFLTKASLVFFPLLIFFIHEIVFKWKEIRANYGEYLKLFSLFFLISGIWLGLGYLKVGFEFVHYYLFQSDQGVAHIDLSKFNPDYISYVYYSLQRRFFWVLLIGAGFALIHLKKPKELLLLLFSFLLLFQLSFTVKSNNWYLMPSMPFWSLLIAYGTYQIIKLTRENKIVICIILIASLYVSYKTFSVNIMPILDSGSAYSQMQSSKEIKRLTKEEEVIVRLDHLYPTTIYYTDRKVLASPYDMKDTKSIFVSRGDLLQMMQQRKIRWLVGTKGDVELLEKEAGGIHLRVRLVNDQEAIAEVL